MGYKKFIKRTGRYVKNAAKKRYVGKRGGVKYRKLANDVMKLKNLVNAEKKRFTIAVGSQPVGQLSGATGQGMYVSDITPIPAQGTTSITRTGNSIRLHSSYIKFQFSHLTQTTQPIQLEIMLVRVKGVTQNSTVFASNMFNYNPFVLHGGSPVIIDLNSDLNPDFYSSYKILKRKRVFLPMDSYAGVTVLKTVSIGLKHSIDHHIRFAADGGTTPSTGQTLLIIRCDSGNISSTTASTLSNVPVSAALTGLSMSYNIYHYFYDN